ncbi:MAG: cobalamin-binding protein [Planctomycetaceae bacterium]
MKRILSLLPAATEMVFALGCGGQLVGRSHECDFPAEVNSLPICTRSRLITQQSSSAINDDVLRTLQEGNSLYQVDYDLIKELKPDVVLTQAQCEVCAISYQEVACELEPLIQNGVKLVSVEVYRLIDLWKQMRNLGKALDAEQQAEEWIDTAHGRISRLLESTTSEATRPRVACIEWFEPLMAAGNWVPELVELAGGENLLGVAGEHSPWMSWEELLSADPDVIVLMPCGFDLGRSRVESTLLTQAGPWSDLRAVSEGRVYLTDGSQFFNRPGPRLVDSIEILAEILHPACFTPEHEGTGWATL